MDTLYIGDIPSEYHYADFHEYYIDLYNTSELRPNNTYNYYRIYTSYQGFYYQNLSRNISQYSNIIYLSTLNVSEKYQYRNDISQIWVMLFVSIYGLLFLFNIVTSMIKKGGVLGGLH